MRAPRALVIDTNVVVVGLLTADSSSPTATVLDGMLGGRFVFLLSERLLAEYRMVLVRPGIRERHGLDDDDEVDHLLAEIVRNGAFREPERSKSKAPDRTDQHLWDLVEAEPGSVLVTGDLELAKRPAKGVRVIGPREVVALLDSSRS